MDGDRDVNHNERARAAAANAGRATYSHEVVDHWPACTACGTPIRRNLDVGRIGLWRGCGCIGVAWTCGRDGWERCAMPGAGERMNESSVKEWESA